MKYFFHENFTINRFNVDLLSWYSLNKRDLPWRKTKDPYKIWLSEIILQQTKVSQGAPYYESFVKNYPRVEDLAKADEQEVLNRWRGLGYYSRAKNLHFTAKIISCGDAQPRNNAFLSRPELDTNRLSHGLDN